MNPPTSRPSRCCTSWTRRIPSVSPEGWRFPRVGTRNAIVSAGRHRDHGRTDDVDPVGSRPLPVPRHRALDRRNAPLTVGVIDRRQSEYLGKFTAGSGDGQDASASHRARRRVDQPRSRAYSRWLEDGSGFLLDDRARRRWQTPSYAAATASSSARSRVPTWGYTISSASTDAARVAWIEAGDDPTQVQIYRVPFGAGAKRTPARSPATPASTVERSASARAYGCTASRGPRRDRSSGSRTSMEPSSASCSLRGRAARASRRHVRFVTVGRRRIPRRRDRARGLRPARLVPGDRERLRRTALADGGAVAPPLPARPVDREPRLVVVSFDGRGTPSRAAGMGARDPTRT